MTLIFSGIAPNSGAKNIAQSKAYCVRNSFPTYQTEDEYLWCKPKAVRKQAWKKEWNGKKDEPKRNETPKDLSNILCASLTLTAPHI